MNSEKAQAVKQPTQKILTAQEQAEEAIRMRNQVEAQAQEMKASQDAAWRERVARCPQALPGAAEDRPQLP